MKQLATLVAESPTMSRDRKEVYLGEALKRLLTTRPKDSLTTVVNLIADRYMGLIERVPMDKNAFPFVCTAREEDVYRGVLAEKRGGHLEAREIALFPSMVGDWLKRHPDYPDSAYQRVSRASFVELLVLIERLERDL